MSQRAVVVRDPFGNFNALEQNISGLPMKNQVNAFEKSKTKTRHVFTTSGPSTTRSALRMLRLIESRIDRKISDLRRAMHVAGEL